MMRLAEFWRTSPRPAVIVAESLRRIEAPLCSPPPAATAPAGVAAAIARSLAPPIAPDRPPQWLLPGQRITFGRALAALRRHGVALIAEPVGSGKSWIGLALGERWEGRTVAIVPAALQDQWTRTGRKAGVPLLLQTHEQWSRGARELPEGLILIDESHRFRHSDIRRYRELAPALAGRTGVLLTATPVVNRLEDAAHQLLLFARDDALAGAGVASLRQALRGDRPPPQLADLIISGSRMEGRPRELARAIRADATEEALAEATLERIDRLRLSPNRPVRQLLGGVFASAGASSPAALRSALQRYRALLLQGGDAGRDGIRLGRRELRLLLGSDLEQTVLWSLLDPPEGTADLIPDDLPALDDCLAWLRQLPPERDPKIARLQAVLADGLPTVVFTSARATVDHVRGALRPPSRIGWCTGAEAGIGPARLPRTAVLRWFGPGRAVSELAPKVLVATDVAAEGLDLQRATRIVHYDLPWTAVRLEQRAGRILRIGSAHARAEIVTLLPPAAIEKRLSLLERLARKGPLPSRIGLGRSAEPVWRWRAELAQTWDPVTPISGGVVVEDSLDSAVAGIALVGSDRVLAQFAVARSGRGRWTSDPMLIDRLLRRAASHQCGKADPDIIAEAARSLQREARAALLGATGSLWRIRPPDEPARPALTRLRQRAAEAVRQRDRTRLNLTDRAISFLRRGHTAGERMLADRLAGTSEAELDDLLTRLPPPDPLPPPLHAVIVGLVVFRSGSGSTVGAVRQENPESG